MIDGIAYARGIADGVGPLPRRQEFEEAET
jgi:hypothetical protein